MITVIFAFFTFFIFRFSFPSASLKTIFIASLLTMTSINAWWKRNAFSIAVFSSVIFFIVFWALGWNKKQFSSFDYFEPKKPRRRYYSEGKCRETVENMFQRPFPSKRPSFLRNPQTGKNLECDMMNSDLKLCIERQGEQHYRHVPHFHRSPADFENQLLRDQIKRHLLQKEGYTLIEIPYTIGDVGGYIREKLRGTHLQRYIRG